MDQLYTIRDFIRWAVSSFSAAQIWYGHGSEDAFDEALKLIFPTLHLSPFDYPEIFYDSRLTAQERELVIKNIRLRTEDRIPTAYITHCAWFAGLKFYVDQRTLIPRSPIAELIQNQFPGILTNEPTRILDLCTGSGCIAIAAAMAFPRAQVDAVDISEAALQVAEINIDSHDLENRVFPIKSDLFDSIAHEKYDLILTNPPYEDAETMAMQPMEYQHEPLLGVLAGENGIAIVRKILAEAERHLAEDGILICEVGRTAHALQEAFPKMPFHWVELKYGGVGVFAIDKSALALYNQQYSAQLLE